MTHTAQIEKAVLSLPPAQRAHVALAAWESLAGDPAVAADRTFDREGIALAIERDLEIESGSAKLLTHEEFLHLTGGTKV